MAPIAVHTVHNPASPGDHRSISPAAATDNAPTVSVLRYKDDRDLANIQRAIIAQYERIGGTTKVHQPLTANIVNPASLGIVI